MNKNIVITGAILICTGIMLGAFGAHSLEKIVNEEGLIIFEKGVKYQMYMGLGFLVIGLASDKIPFNINWFYNFGIIGTLIFSLLLYALAFKEHNESLKTLGAIVPVGGILMIISWLTLIINLIKLKSAPKQ